MPPFSQGAIADALRRLPEEELALALRTKILPVVSLPGLRLFATFGERAAAQAAKEGLQVVATGPAADFIAASREAVGHAILKEATFGLARRFPARSAAQRLSDPQQLLLWLLVPAAVAVLLLVPHHIVLLALSLMGGLFFLAMISVRLFCLLPRRHATRPIIPPLTRNRLPTYSVLVPLFRETSVLGQLLEALTNLDYPADKLDIKLIIEESDILMQRALSNLPLPPHFDCITVPCGLPQTKPRALNYALAYANGELLTIFDAEDIPDADQLRWAAEHFAAAPGETACLQAELVFYNPGENWLTRMFSIEYATLFGVLLPGLAAHGLPFPLGGTSNHFRADVLRRIGAWDPFNVTEDADLGLRLARAGYQTGTISSRTHEEATVRLGTWLRQRARWMKGFLQTWLVHMRNPARYLAEVGPGAFWTTQTMTIGVFASALLHPVCLATTGWYTFAGPPVPADASLATILLAGLSLLVLVAGYGVAMAAGARGLAHLRMTGGRGWLLTLPVYWLLMSAAAWLALWQFITAPHHWNKTEHGLSKQQRRRNRAARRSVIT